MVLLIPAAEVEGGGVVVVIILLLSVGRTAGIMAVPAADADVLSGQFCAPHPRSVGQQPPPRVAGQERKPVLQLREVAERLVEGEVVVVLEGDEVIGVGIKATVDVEVRVVEALARTTTVTVEFKAPA